jgi:hypothetical protein
MLDECACRTCATEFLPDVPSPPIVPLHPLQAITDAASAPAVRRIVGFTGVAGSGKSSAAAHLIDRHGFRRGKFAGALKEMTRAFLRYRGASPELIERMVEGALKEVATPLLNGRTPRHWMQTLGTEFGRVCIHELLWIDTEMDARASDAAVVFDDVRYANEANAILAAGGTMVRVERTGAGASTPGHSSETEVARLPVSMVIRNDRSMAEFLADVSYIFEE